MNALFAAIPGIGNVLLVSLLFWLIFSILGVHLFAGKFFKCVDADNERLPATTVPSKAECLKYPDKYRWENSKVTFDNVLAGFLALMQVVSVFPVYSYTKSRGSRYSLFGTVGWSYLRRPKSQRLVLIVKCNISAFGMCNMSWNFLGEFTM